jgi:hypothetical protein
MAYLSKGRDFKINNGKLVSFWLDTWLGDKPLCRAYRILYEVCLNQNSSVYDVKHEEWVIQFKVRLPLIIKEQWYELASKLNSISPNDSNHRVVCKWTANKQFTVKSVYSQLTNKMKMVLLIRSYGSKKFLNK